ncbi:MAG: hypothetical protein WA977_07840 [Halobacteriota archaeon]
MTEQDGYILGEDYPRDRAGGLRISLALQNAMKMAGCGRYGGDSKRKI